MDVEQFRAQMGLPAPSPIPTVEAIYATGHWFFERENYKDAAKVFRILLHAAPRDERGWLALGECHERHGQPLIALEMYGAGTTVAAPSARCMIGRARVLRALGRDDEAEEAFDQAVQLAAEDEELSKLVVSEKGRAS